MSSNPSSMCWICQVRPGNTSEHRFKASDFRLKARAVTQWTPAYLQRDSRATNIPIGSSKSKAITFKSQICAECNNARTQPFDKAWEVLSEHLQNNWNSVKRRRRFDLSKIFPGNTRTASLYIHLFFVKMLGCKLNDDSIPIDLAPFSKALVSGTAHPEIQIVVSDGDVGSRKILMYESEVHVMRNQSNEIHGAVWLYMVYPLAIKVGYIKAGARLHIPGSPWHPSAPSKLVKLSPFSGGTEPVAGRRALIADPS